MSINGNASFVRSRLQKKKSSDASDAGMGIVMSQRVEKNVENLVLYLSKKFSDAQRKYGKTEKECAAIIYAIEKLNYYLDSQNFTIDTDHDPLEWLKTSAGANPRFMRWSLAMEKEDGLGKRKFFLQLFCEN
ncbi:hypothetical protein AVEN_228267-1 [Araneus ventricosus]|uniref:Reverse transcriptase RNase H-like domain-containing protein n=1 Tax=Araneus ventricosus TaxID=182803 RepID=A0A4Y2PLH8_ARAVE|nr:hypothetical protein AVEN_228267-1 [Araneus ventricosus]